MKELLYNINQSVLNGSLNPLDAYLNLKDIENLLESVINGIKESALKEAEKFGEKSFEYKNTEISIRELGIKYDYSKCNDLKWQNLFCEEEKLKKEKKQREDFLKKINESCTVVDEITGEINKIYPPVKTSTTGLTIKFLK